MSLCAFAPTTPDFGRPPLSLVRFRTDLAMLLRFKPRPMAPHLEVVFTHFEEMSINTASLFNGFEDMSINTISLFNGFMMGKTYYVVYSGRKPGVYRSWPECQKMVNGFPGNCYKSYASYEEADKAFKEHGGEDFGKRDYGKTSAKIDDGPTPTKSCSNGVFVWCLLSFVLGLCLGSFLFCA